MSIFFAWAGENEEFSVSEHKRMDLDIFSLRISQKEWELASLTLEVAKFELPPIEKRYAYVAFERESIRPLFFGKLVNFPIQSHNGLYQLEFVSHIKDFSLQIEAFGKELKNSPYWCESLIDEEELHNPPCLVEARNDLFAWDRVNGKGVVSNLFQGKHKVDLSEHIFYNSLKLSLKQMPLSAITVQVVAEWMQTAGGEINIGKKIGTQFSQGLINTLSPKQFEAGWFRQGRLGQSGYYVVENKLRPITPHTTGLLKNYATLSQPYKVIDGKREMRLRRQWYKSEVLLQWLYEQRRRQVATFTVVHSSQLNEERRKKTLVLRVQRLNPMANASYFHTKEGMEALEYALRVAQAHLGCSARCIEAEMMVPLEVGLGITMDHSITVRHKDIPGGELEGKVTGYKIVATPKECYVKIMIAAAVGEEPLVKSSVQKELYVHENYCTEDFDSSFESFEDQIPQEGVIYPKNLGSHDLIKGIYVKGDGVEQEQHLAKNQYPVRQNLKAVLREVPTMIHLDLLDLSTKPCLEQQLKLVVKGEWSAPKQVDLKKGWF